MTKQFIRGYVERAAGATEPGDPIWFVATTEGRKADGLDLKMDALRLDRFEANPVIGYGHSYWGRDSLPIGRAVDIEVKTPALRLQVEFDQSDSFATTVEQKVRDGYLNAMSVGFDAWDIDDNGVPAAWELFESSVVPIPMDPDALAEVGRAAVRDFRGAIAEISERFDIEEPASTGVRVLRLEDGDVLVARFGRPASMSEAVKLRNVLAGKFPGHEILTLDGVELDVVRTPPVPPIPLRDKARDRLRAAEHV